MLAPHPLFLYSVSPRVLRRVPDFQSEDPWAVRLRSGVPRRAVVPEREFTDGPLSPIVDPVAARSGR